MATRPQLNIRGDQEILQNSWHRQNMSSTSWYLPRGAGSARISVDHEDHTVGEEGLEQMIGSQLNIRGRQEILQTWDQQILNSSWYQPRVAMSRVEWIDGTKLAN